MSILGDARKRLIESGVLPQNYQAGTLPQLYGVHNYNSLPGTQAHAALAAKAGHAAPTGYDGEPIQPSNPNSCLSAGGTWDDALGICVLPGQTEEEAVMETVKDTGGSGGGGGGGALSTVDPYSDRSVGGFLHDGLVPRSQRAAEAQVALNKALANSPLGRLASAFGNPIPTTHTGIARQGQQSQAAHNVGQAQSNADAITQAAKDSGQSIHEYVQSTGPSRDYGYTDTGTATSYAGGSATDKSDPRGDYWNRGGVVYAQNGANLSKHPGEPMGTDDVPAWLTDGEFVIDRDSTRKFLPILEAINDWEPTQGMEAIRSAMDDMINQTNDSQSMQAIERAWGGAVYKNIGGAIQSALTNSAYRGLPQANTQGALSSELRNRALQARNANVRGALLQGGLGGLGASNQGFSNLIRDKAPGASAFDSLGQGQAAAGQANAQFQGDLANIARQGYEDQVASDKLAFDRDQKQKDKFEGLAAPLRKELKALEEGNGALQETSDKAQQLANYVQAAGPAWEVFRTNSSVERLFGIDDFQNWITGAGGSNIDTQVAFLTQNGLDAVQKSVGSNGITQQQANAVSNAVAALDDLATAALKAQGPGVKTNFDFMVARQTITNLQASAPQVVATIGEFVKRINNQISKNNIKIQDLSDEMDGLAAGYGFEPKQ